MPATLMVQIRGASAPVQVARDALLRRTTDVRSRRSSTHDGTCSVAWPLVESFGKRIAALNCRDPLMAEEHTPDAVVVVGSERHFLAGKSLSHEVVRTLKAHLAVRPNTSNHVRRVVFDRRQDFGVATNTRSITRRRNFEPQRFMRSFMVVDLPPHIESLLHFGDGREPPVADQLGLQGPVESFVLAVGLRVQRPRMADAHPEPNQPYG